MPGALSRIGRAQIRIRLVVGLPLFILLIGAAWVAVMYARIQNESQRRALNQILLQVENINRTARQNAAGDGDAFLAELGAQVGTFGRRQSDEGVAIIMLRAEPAGPARFFDPWGIITQSDETTLYTLTGDLASPRILPMGPQGARYLVSAYSAGVAGYYLIALEPYERIRALSLWVIRVGGFFTIGAALAMFLLAWVITAPLHRLAERTRELARREIADPEQVSAILEKARNPEEVASLVLAFEEALTAMVDLKRSLNAIMESMNGAILAADDQGRLEYVNSAAREMMGLEGNLKGRDIRAVVPSPGDNKAFLGLLDDLVEKQIAYGRTRELTFRNGRAETLEIGVTTNLVTDGRGRVLNCNVVAVDLTELVGLQERLRRADRLSALGAMATKVAHEIRNPLGSVKGLTQLAMESVDENSDTGHYLSRVVREVDRLSSIVDELLDYSQRRPLSLEWVDVNEVVKEAIEVAQFKEGAARSTVLQEMDFTLPRARLDRNRFMQAVLNLIVNALQAVGPEGGVVTVSTYREDTSRGSRLVVEIADNGPGITPEVLEHIFDPFYTTKEEGSGLGLSIAHTILKEHESLLDVDSKVGQGATFRIMLPRERWEGVNLS